MDAPALKSHLPAGLPLPSTSAESITMLAHFYRGELARMISWRDRLDRTTNWAIAALAAMLSFSLSSQQAHHSVLLFAMLLIYGLLLIEARRYRFYDVYRARVRRLESEYFAEMFAAGTAGARVTLATFSEELRRPRFSITLLQAMSRRLRRNYFWIFLVVLLAWLVKTTSHISDGHTRLVHTVSEFLDNTAIAGIPGIAVIAGVVALYVWLAFVMFRFELVLEDVGPGQVHV
jgi:uncharacterized membrane protein